MTTFGLPLATFFLLLLILSSIEPSTAARQLHEVGNPTTKIGRLNLQLLDRGDTPPSGASGCTNIPGGGGTGCPLLGERNFAGRDALPRGGDGGGDSAYPTVSVQFGVAVDNI